MLFVMGIRRNNSELTPAGAALNGRLGARALLFRCWGQRGMIDLAKELLSCERADRRQ